MAPLYVPAAGGTHPDLAAHDTMGLATQDELDTHAADTTNVHGITDTSALATDAEVATAVSDHSADTTSVHGIADTANLVLTNDARLTDARTPTAHAVTAAIHTVSGGTSGHVLRQTGATSFAWGAIQAGDVPTLNQNTTGTAANITGTAAIANGGTGQTSATAAFDALAPTTTQGDLIYHNGTDNVRLAKGTGGQVLKMNAGATAPEWGTDNTGSGSSPWTTVVKPADTARTNNTMAADPDLVATLSAATNYTIRLRVYMTTNATADARYALTFSGTTTRVRRQITRTSTGDVPAYITAGSAFDSAAAPIVISTTGVAPYVEEYIIVQVVTGGTLAFQWAQVTTNVGAATVLEGSYLEYATT